MITQNDEDFVRAVGELDEHAPGYIIPEPQQEMYPLGWFHAVSKTGEYVGYGWSCYTCHRSIPFKAPDHVTHCGRTDFIWDQNHEFMQAHVLGSGKTYREVTITPDPPKPVRIDMLEQAGTLFERLLSWIR
jgi:hypothetical protein